MQIWQQYHGIGGHNADGDLRRLCGRGHVVGHSLLVRSEWCTCLRPSGSLHLSCEQFNV